MRQASSYQNTQVVPYRTVAGVSAAFEHQPELVAGGAANTTAGIELVKKLTGLASLKLMQRTPQDALLVMLMRALEDA